MARISGVRDWERYIEVGSSRMALMASCGRSTFERACLKELLMMLPEMARPKAEPIPLRSE